MFHPRTQFMQMGNTGQLLFWVFVSAPAALGGFLGKQDKLNQEALQ